MNKPKIAEINAYFVNNFIISIFNSILLIKIFPASYRVEK
jgi:hypothetical protein